MLAKRWTPEHHLSTEADYLGKNLGIHSFKERTGDTDPLHPRFFSSQFLVGICNIISIYSLRDILCKLTGGKKARNFK